MLIVIEFGLKLVKYGEEVSVDFEIYMFDILDMCSVCKVSCVVECVGVVFEVVLVVKIFVIFDDFVVIFDWWFVDKDYVEKGFSVGWFDCDYMM